MNHLHKLCATLGLTIALAVSTHAGEMHTPGNHPPPGPLGSVVIEPTDITTVPSNESRPVDSVIEATLNLIRITLLLF
jgi:hypothetical protein